MPTAPSSIHILKMSESGVSIIPSIFLFKIPLKLLNCLFSIFSANPSSNSKIFRVLICNVQLQKSEAYKNINTQLDLQRCQDSMGITNKQCFKSPCLQFSLQMFLFIISASHLPYFVGRDLPI